MKIYIQDYLKEIPIINQLYNMVLEYGNLYGNSEDVDSFSDYKYTLTGDNVLKFLDYIIENPKEKDFKNYEDYLEAVYSRKNKINYLSNVFYRTKGTYKVLDYLISFKLLDFSKGNKVRGTKINYTTKSIDITIEELPSYLDRDLFSNYLEKFLESLIYFEKLNVDIRHVSTKLSYSPIVSLNTGEGFYQKYKTGIGRNLFLSTRDYVNDFYGYHPGDEHASEYFGIYLNDIVFPRLGKLITISAEVWPFGDFNIKVYTLGTWGLDGWDNFDIKQGVWNKLSITGVVWNGGRYNGHNFRLSFYTGYGTKRYFLIRNIKVEEGGAVTDYFPAPEIVENSELPNPKVYDYNY